MPSAADGCPDCRRDLRLGQFPDRRRQKRSALRFVCDPLREFGFRYGNPLSGGRDQRRQWAGNGNGANALSGYCNAFFKPARGFPANVLGLGASIGIAPYAAPLCTSATCPAQGTAQTLYFGCCASFPGELGPAVATFIDIGTDGTTVVTTPVSTQKLQCPPPS